jgi:acetyl esterase/lipase
LLGHSAGGHLALWAASRDDARVPATRVIALAPVTNLVRCGRPAHALMGGAPEQFPERYAACDPMQLVPPPVPVLIVHAAADATVPVVRSREYAAATRAAGGYVELVEPGDGGHRALIDPRSRGWRAAVDWLERARGVVSPRSSGRQAAR